MSNLRVALGSAGKRALGSTREGFNHLKAALANLRPAELATVADDGTEPEVKEHLSDRSISSQLLRISAVAVALKALHYFVDRKFAFLLTSVLPF